MDLYIIYPMPYLITIPELRLRSVFVETDRVCHVGATFNLVTRVVKKSDDFLSTL